MVKNRSVLSWIAIILALNVLLFLGRSYLGEINAILDTLSAMTAIVGIIAIWYQLKKDKELNEAQFIFELNNSFYQNEAIMNIYNRCNDFYAGAKDSHFTPSDERFVTQYFSFFGVVYTFLERGILNLEMIDRTFGYRYFLVTNNPNIQDLFLIKDASYYRGNYKLYKLWVTYRLNQGLPIILNEHSLIERFPEGFVSK